MHNYSCGHKLKSGAMHYKDSLLDSLIKGLAHLKLITMKCVSR